MINRLGVYCASVRAFVGHHTSILYALVRSRALLGVPGRSWEFLFVLYAPESSSVGHYMFFPCAPVRSSALQCAPVCSCAFPFVPVCSL